MSTAFIAEIIILHKIIETDTLLIFIEPFLYVNVLYRIEKSHVHVLCIQTNLDFETAAAHQQLPLHLTTINVTVIIY